MHTITHTFDELPIRALGGAAIAHVAGTAEITFRFGGLDNIEITLDAADGTAVSLNHHDPIYLLIWRVLRAQLDAGEIETGIPYRDENAEHRLTTSQVL